MSGMCFGPIGGARARSERHLRKLHSAKPRGVDLSIISWLQPSVLWLCIRGRSPGADGVCPSICRRSCNTAVTRGAIDRYQGSPTRVVQLGETRAPMYTCYFHTTHQVTAGAASLAAI